MMNRTEAKDWVEGLLIGGEPLKFSVLTVTSLGVKFEIIQPSPEQLMEFNFSQWLRNQEGDPKNKIFKDGDKIVLVVYTV